MHTKKFIWLVALWLVNITAYTQNPVTGTNIIIDEQVTTSTQYKASQTVNMQVGANLKANPTNIQHALIDPYMVFPPSTGITGGPNPGDDGVVGALPGEGTVGPMGNYIYSIPVSLPECIPGMTPGLSLVYNSAGGESYMGYKWSLGGMSSISRVPSNIYFDEIVDPVDFDAFDRYAIDGSRLIVTAGIYGQPGSVYGTEAENMQRVYPMADGAAFPGYFKVINPNGQISYYGESSNARVWRPNTDNVVQWLLSRVVDIHGNTIIYEYSHSSAGGIFNIVPSKISYNFNPSVSGFTQAVYDVRFHYITEPECITYANGIAYGTDKLLAAITIEKGTAIIQQYEINYANNLFIGKKIIDNIRLIAGSGESAFNPTRFYYSNDTQILMESSQTSGFGFPYPQGVTGYDYLPGDFNGDGYTDYIRQKWYFHPEEIELNIKVVSGWDLLINNKYGGFFLRTLPTNPANIVTQTGWDIHAGAKIIPANLNGDNKTDLAIFFDYDNKDYVKGDWNDYAAVNKVMVLIADGDDGEFTPSPLQPLINDYRINNVLPVDINGDGLQDLFMELLLCVDIPDDFKRRQTCLLSNQNSNGFINFFSTGLFSQGDNEYIDFHVVNYDGDSKMEIVQIHDTEKDGDDSRIISFNTTTNQWETVCALDKWHIYFFGDYNGDGISDKLTWTNTDFWQKENGTWKVAYGTGAGFTWPPEEVTFDVNIRPDGYNSTNTISMVSYFVGDYNGDGKDDVLQSYYMTQQNCTNWDIYFTATSVCSQQHKKQYSTPNQSCLYKSPVYRNDINGDNKEDITHQFMGDLKSYTFGAGNPEGLLITHYNSMGVQDTIVYKPGKSAFVYENQNQTLYSESDYNVFSSSIPGYVVQRFMKKYNGAAIADYHYFYISGLFHREGKGFLGFEKTKTIDFLGNNKSLIKNKLIYPMPNSYEILTVSPDYTVTYQANETNYLERSQYEYLFDYQPGKRYRTNQVKVLTKSKDLGGAFIKSTLAISNFDIYCQTTSQKTLTSVGDHSIDASEDLFEHKIHAFTTFLPPDFVHGVFNRPDIVSQNMYYRQSGTNTYLTTNTSAKSWYFNTGESSYPLIKEVLAYSGSQSDPMAVKRTFTYNSLGMLRTESTSAPNYIPPAGTQVPTARVTETSYFAQKPYLVRYTTDPKSFITSYEYDPLDLYISQSTDINELVTTVSKDILGIQTQTTAPEGTRQILCKRWSNGSSGPHVDNPQGGLYYTWAKSSGQSEVLTFYNALGQELRVVSFDINGNKLHSDKSYDARGRLISQTTPYNPDLAGNLSFITTNYTYDGLNRIISVTTPEGTSTINYQGRTTSSTDPLGRTSSRTVNAAGWLIESKDHQNKYVGYEYNSMGKPVKTWHSNNPAATLIENGYDAHGNCISLNDPSTGLIVFEYDPFDQLVTRKDPRQVIPTRYVYDVLGRMVQRNEREGTTVFTYDNKPKGKGLPGSIAYASHTTEYDYDGFARLSQATDQINNVPYTWKYSYDAFGRVSKKEFPTGLRILTEYATNGQVAKLYKGGDNPALLWAKGNTDVYGRLVQAVYGNVLNVSSEYEPYRGLLTKQFSSKAGTEFFRREYEWGATGNLHNRKKILGTTNLTETFTYDNLDRLDITTLKQNETEVWSQNLDYDPLGNIGMKLEYPQGYIVNNAQYGESNANPYAITSADVTNTLWPQALQQIEYNSYNKMVSVAEGSDYLEIQYGHDHQRVYQELRQSGITTLKKTFVGSGLEIIERPQAGTLQKIHYLSGGDGNLFAMYIIDETNTGTLYYILTDHLGSPCLITDASGNTIQELSFDAWGKRRDPATWQPYTTNATIPPAFIDRGFTFHEHLYPFTLINMNGRAYDPLVGRFLSPDPYIQAPDNTQNLNRYSYCLNNPLRYTDPSGEFLLEAMIIGGIANWIMSGCEFNTDGLKSFGIGAVAGAASFGAGTAMAGVVGTSGFSAGAVTGATAGFAGGFVSGAGYSWLNGGNFGDGLLAGVTEGGFGALTGGIVGGLSGGIQSAKHGGDFWSGEGATFDFLSTPASSDKIVIGKDMEYSNKYAQSFSDDNFKKNIKGITNLYSDGSIPPKYSTKGDIVFNRDGKQVLGTTRYLGIGKGSDVYLYKGAFTSKRQLYIVMGHEYIHVAHFAKKLTNYKFSEHAALQWEQTQSKAFGVMPYNHMFSSELMNLRYYNSAYDYNKFMINPIINVLP